MEEGSKKNESITENLKESKSENRSNKERKPYQRHFEQNIEFSIKDKFVIHKSIYDEAIQDIRTFQGTSTHVLDKMHALKKTCYSRQRVKFDGKRARVYSYHYFLAAARMALENRDYTTLYEIVNKGLALKYCFMQQQMKNYFLIAVMNDPAIENKEEFINDFLAGVLMLKNEPEKLDYLKGQFLIKAKSNEEGDLQVEDEVEVADNISEKSVDLDFLAETRHRSTTIFTT